MPSRIDDKTLIPLGTVAGLFLIGISTTATGAFWISKVNERLSRIEAKLGIVEPHGSQFITDADAKEKGK